MQNTKEVLTEVTALPVQASKGEILCIGALALVSEEQFDSEQHERQKFEDSRVLHRDFWREHADTPRGQRTAAAKEFFGYNKH